MSTGVVRDVFPAWEGGTLAADLAADGVTLELEDGDVEDFAEEDDFDDVQYLVIGGEGPFQYVATDYDAMTVTLAAPTGQTFEAGTAVVVWDDTVGAGAPTGLWKAEVELDAEGDDKDGRGVILANVYAVEGAEGLIGAHVPLLEDDTDGAGQWRVGTPFGREPIVEGSHLAPESVTGSSIAPKTITDLQIEDYSIPVTKFQTDRHYLY